MQLDDIISFALREGGADCVLSYRDGRRRPSWPQAVCLQLTGTLIGGGAYGSVEEVTVPFCGSLVPRPPRYVGVAHANS